MTIHIGTEFNAHALHSEKYLRNKLESKYKVKVMKKFILVLLIHVIKYKKLN